MRNKSEDEMKGRWRNELWKWTERRGDNNGVADEDEIEWRNETKENEQWTNKYERKKIWPISKARNEKKIIWRRQ